MTSNELEALVKVQDYNKGQILKKMKDLGDQMDKIPTHLLPLQSTMSPGEIWVIAMFLPMSEQRALVLTPETVAIVDGIKAQITNKEQRKRAAEFLRQALLADDPEPAP